MGQLTRSPRKEACTQGKVGRDATKPRFWELMSNFRSNN